MYNSLSQDIYAAYFLKLFNIYKYMGVQMMLIQYSMKNSQGLSFETSSLACQVYYTAKKNVNGIFALQSRWKYPDDKLKNCARYSGLRKDVNMQFQL